MRDIIDKISILSMIMLQKHNTNKKMNAHGHKLNFYASILCDHQTHHYQVYQKCLDVSHMET